MFGFISGFTGVDLVFLICAFVGGVILFLRLVLMAFGFGHDDIGIHDGDIGHDHHVGGDSDTSFQLVSLHGLTAFFLMFGLVGLTLHREAQTNVVLAIFGGGVAGMMMMFIVAYIASWMMKLQSSGNIDVRTAVGEEGTVYLSIPSEGAGQAQISVQNRLRVMDAISKDKQPIPTGERVKVIEVVGGHTLVVERVR